MSDLSAANAAALAHVTRVASAAGASLPAVPDATELIGLVREHGRITLNFHPDRIATSGLTAGLTVAEALAADGRYRSQYETGISNGSRTAFLGGDRDGWELSLFGAAYHADGALSADRPKYGALNLAGYADGAAPRFGSCHLRLRPAANDRSTFTFHDSHLGPEHIGTMAAFEPVLAAYLAEGGSTAAIRALPAARFDPAALGRMLDDYIEAQVHGVIELGRDAEAIVADPSFRGTPTGDALAKAASDAGVELLWHTGFTLSPSDVDDEFRGPETPKFAEYVCALYGVDYFDAEIVGRAAQSVVRTPSSWADFGPELEVLQLIKYLWHTLVAFGRPFERNL
ncbi:DUF3626 domain-containing protein [Hamadaea sp.]|uniref:DUF3626 domain-containing protein n=1 Tax=Hamadaea sp. TaxID=2024425 RepID=UPI0025B7C661|nr:DUF3626 domain-containing protein [Hamadaea sp.]